jgi:hypothetical protein
LPEAAGILAKTELRIPYQRPIRYLPETDYPRASRSFPRIAGSGNEISGGGTGRAKVPPEVKVRGLAPPPENFVFSGNILIIKEKFRGFFENLGIRGKICNILFKKWVCPENFIVIGPENFFQRLFCMCPEKFFGVCPKKSGDGGGRKF